MKLEIIYGKKKDEKDKVKATIHAPDLWDMDRTIAQMLLPLFKAYRKKYNKSSMNMGFPSTIIPKERLAEEWTEEEENRYLEEWKACIDKVIYSFQHLSNYSAFEHPDDRKRMHKEIDEVLKLPENKKRLKEAERKDKEEMLKRKDARKKGQEFPPYERWIAFEERSAICAPIYEKYQPLFDEHKRKIQEGLDLFAKHIHNFWY